MTEDELRVAIRGILHAFDEGVEGAIRAQLAGPIAMEGPYDQLRFQICPQTFGIQLLQTEEEILPDDAVFEEVLKSWWEAADDLGLDLPGMIDEEIPPWLADRWQAAGGPGRIRPAYASYHGTIDETWFDLERRHWCKDSEIWPDSPAV